MEMERTLRKLLSLDLFRSGVNLLLLDTTTALSKHTEDHDGPHWSRPGRYLRKVLVFDNFLA